MHSGALGHFTRSLLPDYMGRKRDTTCKIHMCQLSACPSTAGLPKGHPAPACLQNNFYATAWNLEISLCLVVCHHCVLMQNRPSVQMCSESDKQKGKCKAKKNKEKIFSLSFLLHMSCSRTPPSILLHQTKTNSWLRIEGLLLTRGNEALL